MTLQRYIEITTHLKQYIYLVMKSVQLPAKCNQTSVWSTVWDVHGKENNSHFISNEDIISCFLHIDGIHLNDSGTDIL